MINKPARFKGLSIRIPIMIPIKGSLSPKPQTLNPIILGSLIIIVPIKGRRLINH